MKKTIQLGFCMVFASLILTYPLLAQDMEKEVATLTKNYEKAYNAEDVKALVAMYTSNAVRTFDDGRIYTGIAEIEAEMVEEFAGNSFKVSINHGKTEASSDGTMTSTGTYTLKGTAANGDAVDMNGSYTMTLVKVNGTLKISKAALVLMQ